MSIVLEWRHFSSGTVSEFTGRVNLDGAVVTVTENAEELTVGASTLTIDDPDGDFDIPGHSYIRITETEAPDEEIIWAGFVTIRHIKRANPGFLTGPARIWVGNLDDVNTVIARRILSEDDDADRPAETDVERIQWLFDENFLGPDDTFFSTANPVAMDAANCVGMGVYDVVNDCMLQSGKNSFQQDITTAPATYIGTTFYDFASSTAWSSDLQISNYISDITAEVGTPSPSGAAQTWYASLDTDMERDPTRIYWKVRGQYDGGTVTRTRPATAVNFAARETTASWPLVKTATQANARADRYLLDISTEEDVITTTIEVHPAHVNDARAGRRIQCRFSHLPGYEDWTWMRILNRTVTLVTPLVYRITYTLSPGSIATPSGSCSTALAGVETWDSGAQVNVFVGPPINYTPTLTDVVVTLFAGGNSTTGMGGDPFGPSDHDIGGDFIETGDSRTGWTDDYPSLALAGYSIGGGEATVDWDPNAGGAQSWRAIAMSFVTAATSPVQSAQNVTGGGNTVTMSSPPTEGNLLILCMFGETGGGMSPPDPPTGWTQVVAGAFAYGLNNGWVEIAARCALAGESATVAVGDSSFSHWQFVSEWAIT